MDDLYNFQNRYFDEPISFYDFFFRSAHIWKPQRKLLNSTFNNKILSSFIPVFNQKAEVLSKSLDLMVNTSEMFDISKNLFACTLDMVCGKCMLAYTSVSIQFFFE